MCGIAGALCASHTLDADAACFQEMLRVMTCRGPDAGGTFHEDGCVLLHRRLAVIDPKGGAQPMTFGPFTIVYNGELYNTEDLRRELLELGYRFDGHSDTEVLLKAFHAWGTGCAAKLNGIFAFAVYDSNTRQLTLARDPMGVKPLFYALRGDTLLFASTLDALLCHPDVQPRITRQSVQDLVLLGPGRTPGFGVFKDVCELLPGQLAVFSGGRLQTQHFWQLRDKPCEQTFEEAAEQTRALVVDAIRRQLVSDKPLGFFLSGGLDSSLICAVAARELGQIDTYSVDYQGNDAYFRPGKFQPNSDNPFIAIMQRHLRSRHHNITLRTPELVEALFTSVDARALPGMADVDASMLLLCKAVRERETVVLSGECADEIFGGYPWYRDPEIRAASGFPWSQNTAYRASFLLPEWQDGAEEYVRARHDETLAGVDCLPGLSPLERRMREMTVLNLRWFMQTLLDRKDRMSMHWGLEVRVPFCDRRIVEYLYTLPWSYKDYRGREKGLLRYSVRDLLPPEIISRKKSPYPKTWNPDYMDAVSGLLRQELDDPACPLRMLFRTDRLRALTQENRPLPWYGQLMTTPQTIAYFLQLSYWMRKFKISLE